MKLAKVSLKKKFSMSIQYITGSLILVQTCYIWTIIEFIHKVTWKIVPILDYLNKEESL